VASHSLPLRSILGLLAKLVAVFPDAQGLPHLPKTLQKPRKEELMNATTLIYGVTAKNLTRVSVFMPTTVYTYTYEYIDLHL
jgi:hypothetical protein